MVREWHNTDGKTITAGYLGVEAGNVVLKMPDGRIVKIALVKLAVADNEFVKSHLIEYHEVWRAWPLDARIGIASIDVRESRDAAGGFVYETFHFRFRTDVDLGTSLMKDLARVFELTHYLHSKSPFGILAKPEHDLFEAKLFGRLKDYQAAGGLPGTAGVYIRKRKVFLAPLEVMGVRAAAGGWKIVSREDYDTSTVVHELTHMLTHDMLDNLPLWVNEGFADYIAGIPIEGNAFQVSDEKIKEGIQNRFVRDFERAITRRGAPIVKIKASQRQAFLTSGKIPPLFRVARVLQMTDATWAAGGKARAPGTGPMSPPDQNQMASLYRTAHLIIYYFIQIEGERGVTKIRRFLDENRKQMARYREYVENLALYQKQMAEFMRLPGVIKLEDGRIQYPSRLTPPKAPEGPFTDPNKVKLGGLPILLDGESAEVVGKRIETALIRNLAINLRFIE